MNREDSQRRAERAHRLRALGRTWQEVADTEGYKSRSAARTAVQNYLNREPGETPEQVRRSAAEILRITRSVLLGRFAAATENGKDDTLVMLSREVHRNIDQWTKLHGANAPTATQVDLNINTDPAAIIADTEQRLLAAAQQRGIQTGNTIDAEVIE